MNFRFACLLSLALGLLPGAPLASPLDCEALGAEMPGLAGVHLTEVARLATGDESPLDQCRIRAVMDTRTGTDGQTYALRFELALPDAWNGRFVHQFNGGNDGEVDPATGALSGQSGTGAMSPLARGFAVVSSDAGHDGKANPGAGLAGAARFGFDFRARQMYGYAAVAMLDPVARLMVERYYARPIAHAYGVGCSNGGRHALVAAARMPGAFDGLLAGAPGYNLPKAALQHALDVQALVGISGDLASAFSQADLDLVSAEIRAQCDALDGIEDSMVLDSAACQSAFDPGAMICEPGQNTDCLSPEQGAALQTLHAGALESGAQVYSSFPWDTAINSAGWRFWKLESPVPSWDKKPIIAVMGAASLAQIFTTPPSKVDGSPQALLGFLQDFDLQTGPSLIHATTPAFPESAMEVMAPPGSDNPELAAFRDAGGKLIVFHGLGDPVFSADQTAAYFTALDANNGGAAEAFARYYPVPGMAHCSGGAATDAFDLFSSLVDWVENGAAPGAVEARARPDNRDLPEALSGVSRPLCPFPRVARYEAGDAGQASSFACR